MKIRDFARFLKPLNEIWKVINLIIVDLNMSINTKTSAKMALGFSDTKKSPGSCAGHGVQKIGNSSNILHILLLHPLFGGHSALGVS